MSADSSLSDFHDPRIGLREHLQKLHRNLGLKCGLPQRGLSLASRHTPKLPPHAAVWLHSSGLLDLSQAASKSVVGRVEFGGSEVLTPLKPLGLFVTFLEPAWEPIRQRLWAGRQLGGSSLKPTWVHLVVHSLRTSSKNLKPAHQSVQPHRRAGSMQSCSKLEQQSP